MVEVSVGGGWKAAAQPKMAALRAAGCEDSTRIEGKSKAGRKEGGRDGKKGALEGAAIPRIKNSAGRRETTGFLWPVGRSFSRERVGSILWRAGVSVW